LAIVRAQFSAQKLSEEEWQDIADKYLDFEDNWALRDPTGAYRPI